MKESVLRGFRDYPIRLYVWDEVEKPIGIVQIVHGMAEHMARYDAFARFLNSRGFIALGDDHRGHGKTCGADRLGIVPEGDCYEDTLHDEIMISDYATNEWKDLPLFVFGHSYGSFLTQGYLQQAGERAKAVVLCGSAKQDGLDAKFGRIVANLQCALYGKDKPAKLIRKLSFGSYDKKFKDEKKAFAWGNRDDREREKYLADPMCDFTLSLGFYKSFFNALGRIYKKENLEKVPKDVPLFIISGDRDPVGGDGKLVSKLADTYREIGVKDVEIKLYKDARHELTNELNKEEVFEDVAAFLTRHAR